MAFFSQEKKQQKLILILVVVMVAIFVTVYFGLIRPKSSAPGITPVAGVPGGGTTSAGSAVGTGNNIDDIDFLFLKDPRFLDLKKYGEWPIVPGETGRDNPFEPFEGYVANQQQAESPEQPIEENIGELIGEETLEEVEEPVEEPVPEESEEESIERATIEELLRLLNGGGEES